jgi:hypothetical protein
VGTIKVGLDPDLRLGFDIDLQRKWDAKLKQRWPFAPSALVKTGVVDDVNYRHENLLFGNFCSSYLSLELHQLRRRLTERSLHWGTIVGFGIGEADEAGLGFVDLANQLNMQFVGYDVSEVAVRNGRRFLRKLERKATAPKAAQRNAIHHAEIEQQCVEDTFQPAEILGIYAARFVQFLPETKMVQVMNRLGKFLERRGRVIVLVHPLPEDNIDIPWNTSVPYSWEELRTPLQKGLDGLLEISRAHKCRYYNQIYTAMTLQAV